MQRKTAMETVERLRNLDGTVFRRKCARFVMDHREAIIKAAPEVPRQLNDRAGDIWEPLLLLADLVGGEWPKLAREAALKLSGGIQDGSVMGSLLLDIMLRFIESKVDRMFSRDMVGWLNRRQDRPWAEARQGKEMTELWLAKQLRPYGVRPKTMWIGGTAAKGYVHADFEEVFPRYIARSDLDALLAERGVRQESGEAEAK